MLGSNDLKHRLGVPVAYIADGAGVLVDIVQRSTARRHGNAPEVLLLAPPPVTKLTELVDIFQGAPEKSRLFSREYARIAEAFGCHFLDTAEIVRQSDVDGMHLEVADHRKWATRLLLLS